VGQTKCLPHRAPEFQRGDRDCSSDRFQGADALLGQCVVGEEQRGVAVLAGDESGRHRVVQAVDEQPAHAEPVQQLERAVVILRSPKPPSNGFAPA